MADECRRGGGECGVGRYQCIVTGGGMTDNLGFVEYKKTYAI